MYTRIIFHFLFIPKNFDIHIHFWWNTKAAKRSIIINTIEQIDIERVQTICMREGCKRDNRHISAHITHTHVKFLWCDQVRRKKQVFIPPHREGALFPPCIFRNVVVTVFLTQLSYVMSACHCTSISIIHQQMWKIFIHIGIMERLTTQPAIKM